MYTYAINIYCMYTYTIYTRIRIVYICILLIYTHILLIILQILIITYELFNFFF